MNKELKVVRIDASMARLDLWILPEGSSGSKANDETGIGDSQSDA